MRNRRQALGMSQSQLAGSEFSPSYISLIESGRREPTGHALDVLAARLGTSAEFLRSGVEPAARQELELKLRYAELALQNGEAAEALARFTESTSVEGPPELVRQAEWGTARALEALGRLEDA